MICQLEITKECDERVKVLQPDHQQSTIKSGCYFQEQAQQSGAYPELSRVLSTFNLGPDIIMDSQDDGGFANEETGATMVSYMLQAAECGKDIIRILSDDTDVFVLLVYWVWKSCSVQMERWNRVFLNTNASCTELGHKCLQLLGMHAF